MEGLRNLPKVTQPESGKAGASVSGCLAPELPLLRGNPLGSVIVRIAAWILPCKALSRQQGSDSVLRNVNSLDIITALGDPYPLHDPSLSLNPSAKQPQLTRYPKIQC